MYKFAIASNRLIRVGWASVQVRFLRKAVGTRQSANAESLLAYQPV